MAILAILPGENMKLKTGFLALLQCIGIADAQSADDNNTILQLTGQACENGNYAKAVTLNLPLAAKGIMEAQFNMGAFYAMGQGVPQDVIKARE